MDRVGVRELRQNLSVYLRRVKDGESLEVTEHGHPVAVLHPLQPSDDPLERLRAQGRLRPAVGSFKDIPLPPGPPSYAGTNALMEDREGKE
jgi:prevent-host-death family protein